MADRTSGGVYNRRKGALQRLETQLKSGKKPGYTIDEKTGKRLTVGMSPQELTEHDTKRINKEVERLRERVK